jgi:hypothetical protein
MNNMGTQCGGVLWRQEVVENDVEAKSEEGRTYDLTFWKFSEVVVGFRVVEVIELSKVPSCRVCWSGIGCWSKNCILNQRIAVERECVCVWDVLMEEEEKVRCKKARTLNSSSNLTGGEKDACWGFSLAQRSVYGKRENEICRTIQRI